MRGQHGGRPHQAGDMIDVDRWLKQEGLAVLLVMQVHDELVLEVPQAEVERLKVEPPVRMAGRKQSPRLLAFVQREGAG